MLKVLQQTSCGKPMTATLPPGLYYVGDDCYVLGEQLQTALTDLIFPEDSRAGGLNLLVSCAEARLFVWRTMCGDGSFPVRSSLLNFWPPADGYCGVDSGALAVISVDLLGHDKMRTHHVPGLGALVYFHEEVTVTIDEHGNLTSPNGELTVTTSADEQEEA